MDKDFIKWCCNYAEGFEYDKDIEVIIDPDNIGWSDLNFEDNRYLKIIYPLLLQETKQGYNKYPESLYRIDILGINVFVVDNRLNKEVEAFYDNDEGMESALKYIKEQLDE